MSLRAKTLLTVLAALVVAVFALFFAASTVTRAGYLELERQNANRDLQRLGAVFLAELKQMFSLLEDYASWNETYDFARSKSSDYVEAHLSGDTFSNLGIDILIIVNGRGTLLHGSVHGHGGPIARQALRELRELVGFDGDLLEDYPVEFGLVEVAGTPVQVALAPILRSDDSGPPRGIVMIGRLVDEGHLRELRAKTQVDASYQIVEGGSTRATSIAKDLEASTQTGLSLNSPPSLLDVASEETLVGHVLMPGILGKPLLLWSVAIPRTVYQQGKDSLRVLIIAMSIVGVAALASVLVLLERLVLRRLASVSRDVREIGHSDDLSARVQESGNDELGLLGQSVNQMLEQIEVSKKRLAQEHDRAETLLLNILPAAIAGRLKSEDKTIADAHEHVTVLFADIVGFTELSDELGPRELVAMLNRVFSEFDDLAERLGLEKIKTIGDAYMVAAGLPDFRDDHAEAIAEMALQMVKVMAQLCEATGHPLHIRIGINSGQVVAGVIGKKKFIYDLWGDTVNIASRMESTGETGMIQVTEATWRILRHGYRLEKRGSVDVKGRGRMTTYILLGRKQAVS